MRFLRMSYALVTVALALGGCSLVVDGEVGSLAVDQAAKQSTTVRLRDFSAHVGQLVTVELVDPSDRQLHARAVIDPLPSVCADLRFFRGAQFSANRIDFWADLNMSRVLDDPPADHAWRFPVPASGDFLYVHNTDFTFIATDQPSIPLGEALTVNITGADSHEGEPVLASMVSRDLVDPGPPMVFRDSVSGIYRLAAVTGGVASFTLPGIVDSGTEYTIELTFGDNVERCSITQRSPTTGTFLVEADFATLDCAAPEAVDCAALDAACGGQTTGPDCDTLHRQCPFIDCAR